MNMRASLFSTSENFRESIGVYSILPFKFARIPGLKNKVLLTSEAGEFLFLSQDDLQTFVNGNLDPNSNSYLELQSKHFLVEGNTDTAIRLIAAKLRTKKSVIQKGPALHIFVVTLRCNHSCPYCQVSRQTTEQLQYEMSEKTALASIDRLFESPSQELTVEYQGGEPLLAFNKIKFITEEVVKRNLACNRKITFSITSTLHFITDEILDFFKKHNFQVSTSIDGPAWLHNKNRPVKDNNSYEKTIKMLEKTRAKLGIENVAALVTLTKDSLEHPKEIVDEYVKLGFRSIFLRPLSPYGFAVKSKRKIGYTTEDYLKFFVQALSYIIELNLNGVILEEAYISILLTHILTPFPTGYVDLRSPTGAGIGVLVYNYDESVYASDESRMLAEMGDLTFRLGNVHQPYQELMKSEAIELLLGTGIAESLPGCSDCAFLPYCGADPVFHLASQGDPVGYRYSSSHCIRHTHIFNLLFKLIAENNENIMRVLLSWVMHKPYTELIHNEELR